MFIQGIHKQTLVKIGTYLATLLKENLLPIKLQQTKKYLRKGFRFHLKL